MISVRIGNEARRHVRGVLSNYKTYKADIKELEQNIMNPHKEADENIGGGRSTLPVFAVEEKAIKLATNEQLAFRAKAIRVVDQVLASSSDEAQKIIELKYFGKKPNSWVKIAQEVEGYSEDGCRKIERKIVERIAIILGW